MAEIFSDIAFGEETEEQKAKESSAAFGSIKWITSKVSNLRLKRRERATLICLGEIASSSPDPGEIAYVSEFSEVKRAESKLAELEHRLHGLRSEVVWWESGKPTSQLFIAGSTILIGLVLMFLIIKDDSNRAGSHPGFNEIAAAQEHDNTDQGNNKSHANDFPDANQQARALWKDPAPPPALANRDLKDPKLSETEVEQLREYVGAWQKFEVIRDLDGDGNFGSMRVYGGHPYEIGGGSETAILITTRSVFESGGEARMWIREIDEIQGRSQNGFKRGVVIFKQSPEWAVNLMEAHLDAKIRWDKEHPEQAAKRNSENLERWRSGDYRD